MTENSTKATLNLVSAPTGGNARFAIPGESLYPDVAGYAFDPTYGQFTTEGGADEATVTFSASPEFAATNFSVRYVAGGTRADGSDKITVTRTSKLAPATRATGAKTRPETRAKTRAATPYPFTDEYTITIPYSGASRLRTHIDAWVRIKSFDGPGGTDSIRVVRYAGGGNARILYIDDQGKLQPRKDISSSIGKLTQENVLLFQGGSVVGMDAVTPEWADDGSVVKFNPSRVPVTTWSSVPGYTAADYTAGLTNTSDPAYNNVANIRLGKGDPCALVGYSGAEIAAMSDAELQTVLDNAFLRLPTVLESVYFAGGPQEPIEGMTVPFWKDWKLGNGNVWYLSPVGNISSNNIFPNKTSPIRLDYWDTETNMARFPFYAQGSIEAGYYSIVGYRSRNYNDGSMNAELNPSGYYLTSTIYDGTLVHRLAFSNNSARPAGGDYYTVPHTVRCVGR